MTKITIYRNEEKNLCVKCENATVEQINEAKNRFTYMEHYEPSKLHQFNTSEIKMNVSAITFEV